MWLSGSPSMALPTTTGDRPASTTARTLIAVGKPGAAATGQPGRLDEGEEAGHVEVGQRRVGDVLAEQAAGRRVREAMTVTGRPFGGYGTSRGRADGREEPPGDRAGDGGDAAEGRAR